MSKYLLATLVIFCSSLTEVNSITVSTKYGDIEGFVTSYPNVSGPFKSVSKFLGIPYADPPTGELRFQAPQPLKEWKPSVRLVKNHGPICWQSKGFEFVTKLFVQNFTYSEDCLYLDIYSPNVSSSLPVMFYIHGGGYELGSSITYPGDILSLQGVVVVVIQYRLGPFGFFTTGDSAAPGNYGMLDQVEALKWVNENIEKFGGNANKVTIFGASAGGLSVSLQVLSPLSKDLFHQAIAESGVDLSPQAMQPTSLAVTHAKSLAEKLACPVSDHDKMVTCIRDKTPTEIMAASTAANFEFVDHPHWSPVVDKNFLPDSPQNLRRKGEFNKVTLMVSFNSNEGAGAVGIMANYSYVGLMQSVENGVSKSFFKTFVAKFAQVRESRKETAALIADAMEFMYTPWPDNSDKSALRSQLVDLLSDYYYFAASHEVADSHSQFAPVYMYEFAHRSIFSLSPKWVGVDHGTNAPYDFGNPLKPVAPFRFSEADKNVSLFIMASYKNFASSGDPSPQPLSGVTWEKYNSSHRAYLRVDANPRMAAAFNPRRMAFWNDYYPKLRDVDFDNKKDVASTSTRMTMAVFSQIAFLIISAIFKM